MRKSIVKSDGFTRIEMFIALVILAFAMVALAGLMVTTTRNNSFSGYMAEAATLAQDKLEEFRAVPWDGISSGEDQKKGTNGVNYQRTWNVVTNTHGTLKTVILDVKWKDKNTHSVQMISVINKKGSE